MPIMERMYDGSRYGLLNENTTPSIERGRKRMKRVSWRAYLGCLAFFVFACLFLSGAQRLIAADKTSVQTETLSCREAWLCSAPSSAQDQQTSRQRSDRAYGDSERVIHSQSEYSVYGRMQRRSDANGNVLSGRNSYLRAVYQAFPLGDGFA